MARGGARAGAGRKQGSVNRRSQEAVDRALQGGVLPLDYMLKVMRNKNANEGRRDDMAKAAAPYVHAKLQAVQHSGPDGEPIQFNMINRPPKEE